MNSEPNVNNTVTSSTNGTVPIDPQVEIESADSFGVSSSGEPYDREELAFAKAPTLMLEEDDNDDLVAPFNSDQESVSQYYVHGFVVGQRACLITNLTNGSSQTLFQNQMVWTIGRNREAALPLRDRSLSRRHAVILYLLDEGFYLVDLNSMNGTYLNGVRVQQRQLLRDGDQLRMGSIKFNFFSSSSSRTIDPLHPEVLSRFTNPSSRTEQFIDYSALEEPEILFNTRWSS